MTAQTKVQVVKKGIVELVLDAIAPAVPEWEREKEDKEGYIDSLLEVYDKIGFVNGIYRNPPVSFM